ncbi:MAG: acetate--CoA ligase family protein [Myxococcota bacterium]
MTDAATRLSSLAREALSEGRRVLLEPELYEVLSSAGVPVPAHVWLRRERALPPTFTGRVVVKVVSPDILHKSDVGGVRFADASEVTPDFLAGFERAVAAAWAKAHGRSPDLRGVLVMQAVDSDKTRLGAEVLLGLKHTRDFGFVGVIGFGGVKVELLGSRLPREEATALFCPEDVDAALVALEKTLVYRDLAGALRGSTAAVTDATWRRLLTLLSSLAREQDGVRLEELELNPLMLSRDGQLVAVDALARVSETTPAPLPRPLEKLDAFFRPKSVCVAGVSGKGVNMGRVILRNLLRDGFSNERLSVLKPGETEVDGVRCFPSVDALPQRVDLAVLAVAASAVPELLEGFIRHDKAQGLIVIPGGMAEKEGGAATQRKLEAMLADSRATPGKGPLVLGPNSMGVASVPGGYDTTFIPAHKQPRTQGPLKNLAFISQSGAFTLTRTSHLTQLSPRYLVSAGNQMDLTIGEVVDYVSRDDEVRVIAVYVEGFQPLDGRRFLEAARRARKTGQRVVLYQGGRSPEGAGTAAGHTASIAGDARVCWHLSRAAGVLVAESFADFEGLVRVSCALAGREVRGRRVMLMSNAGFEAVGMADSLRGERYALELAHLSSSTKDAVRAALHRCKVDELVDVKNPLDVTPVAPDAVHLDIARAVLADDGVDALVLGVVPMSPALSTLADAPDEKETLRHETSLARTLPVLFRETTKPVVAVVDAGPHYEPLVRALEAGGLPVFRAADEAVRALGAWLG